MSPISLHPMFRQGTVNKLRRELSICLQEAQSLALQQLDEVRSKLGDLSGRGLIVPQPELLARIELLRSLVAAMNGTVTDPESLQQTSAQLEEAGAGLRCLLDAFVQETRPAKVACSEVANESSMP